MLEIADEDISRIDEIKHALGELAAGTLPPMQDNYKTYFTWYRFYDNLLPEQKVKLVESMHAHAAFTPTGYRLRNGLPLLLLAYAKENPTYSEFVVPMDPPASIAA